MGVAVGCGLQMRMWIVCCCFGGGGGGGGGGQGRGRRREPKTRTRAKKACRCSRCRCSPQSSAAPGRRCKSAQPEWWERGMGKVGKEVGDIEEMRWDGGRGWGCLRWQVKPGQVTASGQLRSSKSRHEREERYGGSPDHWRYRPLQPVNPLRCSSRNPTKDRLRCACTHRTSAVHLLL